MTVFASGKTFLNAVFERNEVTGPLAVHGKNFWRAHHRASVRRNPAFNVATAATEFAGGILWSRPWGAVEKLDAVPNAVASRTGGNCIWVGRPPCCPYRRFTGM